MALVTHAFAARTFSGDAAAVGKTLTVDGTPHTVIGVLPPEVRDLAGVRADVWPVLQLPEPQRRGPFGMFVVARLADGVTVDAARRDLARISAEIFPLWAASYHDSSARASRRCRCARRCSGAVRPPRWRGRDFLHGCPNRASPALPASSVPAIGLPVTRECRAGRSQSR